MSDQARDELHRIADKLHGAANEKALRRILDILPEDQYEVAKRILDESQDPVDRLLAAAPPDDEPWTAEDEEAMSEAEASYERGEFVTHEELLRDY